MTAATRTGEKMTILKSLYVMQTCQEQCRPDALANTLSIDTAELQARLALLQDDGLLTYDDTLITLTPSGEALALELFFEQTQSVEDFVKAVYTLQQHNQDDPDGRVSTSALKDALSISAPSVTDMAQRLVDEGLIDYVKYYGMRLTPIGERIALNIIRRHRLIELYLVRELGYQLHEVHVEAEALEHAVSERFVQAITEKMGNPTFDPHGDPIPDADGKFPERSLQSLVNLPLNTPARISQLTSEDGEMLAHTQAKGFTLGTHLEVLSRDPFEGPITIKINEDTQIIGHLLAQIILVETLT